MDRRKFLQQGALVTAASLTALDSVGKTSKLNSTVQPPASPMLISTWDFGNDKHIAGYKILSNGGKAIDAVEASVRLVEADIKNQSVGIGGLPDRDGHVTLDACVMNELGDCGSVMFLEHISHPVSVARLVMEKTPHVYLAGDGALQFALESGFKKENILSEKSKQDWEAWCKKNNYNPVGDKYNHDTIGMLAIDVTGNLSGACSTSGAAYKMHGRVGDSPIIGAGLYVDNEIGAATATGLGEMMIKVNGSFLIIELMRNGKSAQEACEIAVKRIVDRNVKGWKDNQACFLAVAKDGSIGAFSLHKGFQYTLTMNGETKVVDSRFLN